MAGFVPCRLVSPPTPTPMQVGGGGRGRKGGARARLHFEIRSPDKSQADRIPVRSSRQVKGKSLGGRRGGALLPLPQYPPLSLRRPPRSCLQVCAPRVGVWPEGLELRTHRTRGRTFQRRPYPFREAPPRWWSVRTVLGGKEPGESNCLRSEV